MRSGGIMVRKIIVAIVVFAVVNIGIWYYVENLSHTPIGEILANPRNYDEKITTISGEVTDRTSLFIVKYFVLKDKTGEITVVTERPLPVIGSKVRVRGKVKESFALGNEQKLVFVEVTDANK
jgi:hypothetical protein